MPETYQVTDGRLMPSPSDDDATWIAWANEWPTVAALGLRCTELAPGRGSFALETDPFVPNPNGAVNGGILAAVVDQAMGVLAARSTQEGHSPRTASLQVQYHRPARAPLTLRATVIPGGRRIQFVEVVVTASDGERCATGHATMVTVSVAPRSDEPSASHAAGRVRAATSHATS